jgi:hypothetical protein
VAFLDEEEEELPLPEAPGRPTRPPRPPRAPRQQLLIRRLAAVGVGVLFVILLVVAFKGCLNARKERAIKDFGSSASSLVGESNQVGESFFKLLGAPSTLDTTEFGTQVKSYRGATDSQYDRLRSLSTPSEMSAAKQSLLTAFALRRNAMATVADNIDQAFAKEGAIDAQQTISDQMKLLYASDQVYLGVTRPTMDTAAKDQGISGFTLPPAVGFMPPTDPEQWLDPTKVSDALGQVSGASSTTTTTGVHGMSLLQTSIGDTTLDPSTPVEVPSDNPVVNVEVQNGGESEESGVTVTVAVGADTQTQTIPRIGAGETQVIKFPLTTLPPSGEQTTIDVKIDPVPGEQSEDNNSATYTVTFQ